MSAGWGSMQPYIRAVPMHRRTPHGPGWAFAMLNGPFGVPLCQVNGRDTRVRVAVESHRAKEGPLFFMTRGKYLAGGGIPS